jgi:hypothetical protein
MDAPAPGEEPPRTAAKQARPRGLAAHLAHARELQVLVESGRFSSIRAIGKHQGLSGARVSQLLNLLDLLFPIFVVHAPLGQLDHLIQAVTPHLPVGLVLHHQVRDFHLSICIVEGKLCGQIIRHRWNGDVSFWHIGLIAKVF